MVASPAPVRVGAWKRAGRAVALIALGGGCFASAAVAAPSARTEAVVQSTAPDAAHVGESYVQLYSPLPASVPAHPAACDWIGYLRFWDRGAARPARQH